MRLAAVAAVPILLMAGLSTWAVLQGLAHTLAVGAVFGWMAGVAALFNASHTAHGASDSVGATLDALVQTAPCAILAAVVLPWVQGTDVQVLVLMALCLAMAGHGLGIGFCDHPVGQRVLAWLRPVHPGFGDHKVAILVAEAFAQAGVEPVLVNIHANPANNHVSVGCSGWTTEAQRAVMDGVARRLARMRRTHGFPSAWGGGHHVPNVALSAHQKLQLHKATHA
jgi:hypothetical protein